MTKTIFAIALMFASLLSVAFAAFMWLGMRIAQMAPGENKDGTDFIAWIVIAVILAVVTGAGAWQLK